MLDGQIKEEKKKNGKEYWDYDMIMLKISSKKVSEMKWNFLKVMNFAKRNLYQ